jgi:redox-sensitive bicupin YhaK (pirin superfamily)
MIDIRPFTTLGAARHGWLNARHHFSFGQYRNPDRMSWGRLRVWNDDEIAPGTGFDPHPHRDMEIITYVRHGAITHRDNLGNEGRTVAGDVQVMSAGSGVVHSEYNLEAEPTSLFQIWITPDTLGAKPHWGTRPFPRSTGQGFVTLASGQPDAGEALPLNADATLQAASLANGEAVTLTLAHGRAAYLVVAKGQATLNGQLLDERDAAAIVAEETLTITAQGDGAELVLVETEA